MAGRTLAFALSFALPLFLVRRLSKNDLGLYRQAFLVVGSAVQMLPLGFHMSAFYFLPREPERRGQVVLNITLAFALLAGLASLALAVRPTLLVTLFNSAELVPYARVISLVLLLWVFSSFLEATAIANQEVRAATLFIVGLQLTRTLLLLGAAVFFGTVGALVWAAVAQGLLQSAVLLFYLQSRFRPLAAGFDFGLMRRQLGYAVPLGLAGLMYALQLDVHNYFVSHQFGEEAFAIYSTGCFQLPLIHILSDSVGSVMIPRVSDLQKRDDRREIVLLTARMMRKLAAVYFPLYAFLLVMGREFIVTLFTENYAASWPVFAVNLTMILAYFMSNVYDPVLRAYAEHRYFLLRVRAVLLGALLLVLWLGTRRLGLVGVITVVVVANLTERLIASAKVARVLGFGRADFWLLRDTWKIAASATVAALMALAARALSGGLRPFVALAAGGVVFAAVYAAGLLWLKVLTPEERESMRRRAARARRLVAWKRAADHPA
jgi:O-antigen/teichoic acid export membrane protein